MCYFRAFLIQRISLAGHFCRKPRNRETKGDQKYKYSTCFATRRIMNSQVVLGSVKLCSHILQTSLNEGRSLVMTYFTLIFFSIFSCSLSNIKVFTSCIICLSRIMLHLLSFTLSKNSTKS